MQLLLVGISRFRIPAIEQFVGIENGTLIPRFVAKCVVAFCGKTRGVSYGNGMRFVSKWEAFCGKTRFVLPPRRYPMIIRDANEIDVSFYLHCLMNLWHMCQFFSAKIRLKIE
jgi:hypothetical protein